MKTRMIIMMRAWEDGSGWIREECYENERVAVTLGYNDEGKRIYKTKSGFKTKKRL